MALFMGQPVASPMPGAWGRSPGGMDVDVLEEGVPLSLEEEYASIMGRVLSDEADAKQAVEDMEHMCRRRAEQLRREVAQAVHRPMRYMHLQNLAQELEAQAATWHLVWCLYCDEQPPSGSGGPEVMGAGGRVISRQMLADRIRMNPALNRCASVVAWLESLADDTLTAEAGPRFAKHEGVWLETSQRLGESGVVTELDPDAPGRQGAGLHGDNMAAEQRLMARCWQLVRAGRFADARTLCRDCGQPWRAASLGGHTGEWGPLPVGVAAGVLEEDMEANPAAMAEEMAAEIELGGPAAPRALWKWACLQVALQAGASPTPGSQYEAALYGVLAGHLPSVLPMCTTWRDQCWAYCRTWLDQAADMGLAEDQGNNNMGVTAQMLGTDDVIVDVVCKWAGSASKGRALAQGALAASSGVFQVSSQWDGVDGAARGTFEGMFTALKSSGVAAVAAAAADPLCQVQQLLIQNDMSGLTQHLSDWLVAGTSTDAVAGGGGAEEDASLGLPPRAARSVAFGCHVLLALEALGVLYADGAPQTTEDVLTNTRVAGLSEQVVAMYSAGLMERGRFDLVPQYLCHMSQAMRDAIAHEALTALTQHLLTHQAPHTSQVDSQSLAVYCAMERWFSHCWQRQQEGEYGAQEEGGRTSYLRTSVRPDEIRILLNNFVKDVRLTTMTSPTTSTNNQPNQPATAGGVGYSPLGRVTAARWLQYPYLAWQQQQQQEQQQGRQEGAAPQLLPGGDAVWLDGLVMIVALCCELGLGGGQEAAAAMQMLDNILPQGFDLALAQQIDLLTREDALCRARQQVANTAEEAEMAAQGVEEITSYLATFGPLVAQLRAWRSYFELVRGEAGWREVVAAGVLPGGVEEDRLRVVEGGRELMTKALGLLQPPSIWMSQLFMPSQVPLGPASEIKLVVTTDPTASTTSTDYGNGAEVAAGAEAPAVHPYPLLKGAMLATVEQHLRSALSSALESLLGPSRGSDALDISVTSPDSKEGHVTVSMAGDTLQPEVVQVLLELSYGVVQGSLPGLMQGLQVANLEAPEPFTAAICMRCCLAKVVLLCSRLRHGLAVLRDDGTAGEELVTLLATAQLPHDVAGASGRLAGVLSAGQLAEVLRLEAETAVQLMAHAQARVG